MLRNIPALLEDKVVVEVAKYHRKTCAQILLRYLVQALAVAVIPKSCNTERLRENFEVIKKNYLHNECNFI